MKNKIQRIVLFLGIFGLIYNSYSGDANFKSYFGAKTLALNGMYFAGVDGITANLNNPSTIAYLNDAGIDLTFFAKIGEYTYVNPDNGMYTSYREEDLRAGFGAYWSLTDKVSLSLGYLPVIDYRIDWPFAMLLGDELNQVILTFDMFNNISVDAISFDIAYTFKTFALGVALNAYQIQHKTAFPIATPDWNTSSILRGAYQFNYDQDAWTFGFNLGFSWDVTENLKLGALLKSGYQADLSGTAASNMFHDMALADTTFTGSPPPGEVTMNSKIEFPWITGIGVIYKANERLHLNLDLQYNLWGSIQNEMNIEFNDQTWNNGLTERDSVTGIQASTLMLPAENNLEFGMGIEYFSSPDLVLRAGYRFSQTSNKPETYNLAFPTVNQHWISAGIGFTEDNYQINLTAAYAFGVIEEIAQAENKYWYGHYDGQTFIPAISVLYQF